MELFVFKINTRCNSFLVGSILAKQFENYGEIKR